MQEIRDPCAPFRQQPSQRFSAGPAQVRQLRLDLTAMAHAAANGTLPLRVARPEGGLMRDAPGHFHLSAELFLQCAGFTQFQFPTERQRLEAGSALLVPARVLHDERVGSGGPAPSQAFRNIVLHIEDDVLSCHVAHEHPPGRPALLHLESLRHPQATRVHDWLADAARLGHSAQAGTDPWAATQARALVAAALASTLRLLEAMPDAAAGRCAPALAAAGASAEAVAEAPAAALPELLAHASLLLANQLGEQGLSVQSLARQCGCSADHLSRLFARHHGGQTLKARILQLRLARAAQLLADTPLAVKEVAWACGFAAAGHFIHTFRAHHGSTPQAWREAQRQPGHWSGAGQPPLPEPLAHVIPGLG